jgi:hypothetical protein
VEGNEVAHQVNAEIRRIADRFDALDEADNDLTWLCVCGCFGRITMSIAEYDACAGEVYADGHRLTSGLRTGP